MTILLEALQWFLLGILTLNMILDAMHRAEDYPLDEDL